jgi:hypothetical protein
VAAAALVETPVRAVTTTLEAQRILPLAELVAGHDQGSLAAAHRIRSAWSVDCRAGRAARGWLNDLRQLHVDLLWVHDQLLALHVDRDRTKAAVSAVTTAMIANQQERGRDRRIRPLPPAAHLALEAYLHERVALMNRVCTLLDGLDPPRRLRRTTKAIARLAASVGGRADILLAEINRPPRA